MADPPDTPDTHALTPATWTAVAALWGRAVEQTRASPLIEDPAAAEWLDQLHLDTSRLSSATATQVAVCARARTIDQWVTEWAAQNDQGVVVELGVGLSTRAHRLGELNVNFIGVDQADAARLRDGTAPIKFTLALVADVTEFACLESLKAAVDSRPVCFVAEGLFMFLEVSEVNTLLAHLAAAFPGATLLFDAYARPTSYLERFHDSLGHLGEPLRSTWTASPCVKRLESRTLRDHPEAFARLPWVYRLPGVHRLHATHRAVLTAPRSAQ